MVILAVEPTEEISSSARSLSEELLDALPRPGVSTVNVRAVPWTNSRRRESITLLAAAIEAVPTGNVRPDPSDTNEVRR